MCACHKKGVSDAMGKVLHHGMEQGPITHARTHTPPRTLPIHLKRSITMTTASGWAGAGLAEELVPATAGRTWAAGAKAYWVMLMIPPHMWVMLAYDWTHCASQAGVRTALM